MQTYNKPNLDTLNQYLKNNSRESQSINWWSLPLGTSVVRILPPWDSTGRIALAVYSHRIEYQPAGSQYKKYSWVCVDKTFGNQCNICKGLEALRLQGINTEAYDSGNRTFYVNALVVQDANYGRDPNALNPYTHVLMRIPKTVYDWVVQMITNPAFGDITDVNTGIDLMISRSGKGLDTKYQVSASPNGRTAISPEVLNSFELYDLSKIFGTGFSDEEVTGLVNSLNSAGAQFAQQMPSMPSQMYPPQQTSNMQPPVQAYQTPMGLYDPSRAPQSAQPYPSSPYQVTAPTQPSIPPQQYSPASTAPIPQVGTTPVAVSPAPSNSNTGKPGCFGSFNEDGVQCVICSEELECRRCSKTN